MIYFGVTVIADTPARQESLAKLITDTMNGGYDIYGKQMWPFKGYYAGLEERIVPDSKCKWPNYNYVVMFRSSFLCYLYFKWILRRSNDVYLFGFRYPTVERSVSA